jgi:glycosyltransferase involved in cell wall biosynthesis
VKKIAIDVTGLAWNYRTGVQNLFWSYVEAVAENPELLDSWDINFYDRSGIFNKKVNELISQNYHSPVFNKSPDFTRKFFRFAIKRNIIKSIDIKDQINQVYNWDIYNPKGSIGSITIPDILPIEYPDLFDSNFLDSTIKSLNFAKNDAKYIFCISNYIKSRVVESWGIDEDRINISYPGISSSYFDTISESEKVRVLKKYSISNFEYIISTGFIDPRKNLKRQIEAFRMFSRNIASNNSVKYVITGLKNSMTKDILDIIDTPELSDKIIFLGYVPFDDFRIITSCAKALLYCSIAEGFGLPIIEAMAMKVPVITSNTTSMFEIAQGRALTVNPENVEEIYEAIGNIFDGGDFTQEENIESNFSYSQKFTIKNYLMQHLNKMI